MDNEYFRDKSSFIKLVQLEGLVTEIITGLDGERTMMVLSSTLPGYEVPLHSHPHEQTGVVFSGEGELHIADQIKVVKKGDFYYIPPNVLHGDKTIGDKPFVMLDFFCPVREDFIKKLQTQNRL